MTDEHNHYPIAAAVACLAEIAKQHGTDGLIQASRFIDMAPTSLLRGASFLSECLETYEDAPPMQAQLARCAIQEITALCAVLIEIRTNAAASQILNNQTGVAP